MSRLFTDLRGFLLVLLMLLGASTQSPVLAQTIDAQAIDAYRSGDYDTARTLWVELLEAEPPVVRGAERARLLFNLGNLAVRTQQDLEAVGWYSASLRLRPRDADTRANLELARLNAELEPADRGDLKDTLARLLGSLTPGESRTFAWVALLPLAVCLLLEALRGGQALRWLCLGALGLAILGSLPLGYALATSMEAPVLIVEAGGAKARSEPRSDAERISVLEAGEPFDRIASYPGWVQLRLDGGKRGWVPETSVFVLDR